MYIAPCCIEQWNVQVSDKQVPMHDLAGCNKALVLQQSVRFARTYCLVLASTAVSAQHSPLVF
jgi:hypothetical protein